MASTEAIHEVVLATTNRGKLRELEEILGAAFRLVLPDSAGGLPEVEEDGATFEANARKKAAECARALGRAVLADDSGLEVDALDGAPGVRSARYSDPGATPARNNEKLLAALAGTPPTCRTARFVCVLALADARGEVKHVARGTCEGVILEAPRGSGGFGYDPLFLPRGSLRSMAELPPAEKHRRSHRGAAARLLVAALAAREGSTAR